MRTTPLAVIILGMCAVAALLMRPTDKCLDFDDGWTCYDIVDTLTDGVLIGDSFYPGGPTGTLHLRPRHGTRPARQHTPTPSSPRPGSCWRSSWQASLKWYGERVLLAHERQQQEGRMKVFWWQGGLQIQPETEVEAEAMLFLLSTLRYERPPDTSVRRTANDDQESGQVERGRDLGM